MATNDTAKHAWRFFRAGGSDQVALTTGDDIAHLAELDQKLWTALSFPTEGIRADIKTLELLDTDHDKRVRAPEVLAAVDWLNKRLTTLDGLVEGKDTVPLSSINTETEEGKGRRRLDLASGYPGYGTDLLQHPLQRRWDPAAGERLRPRDPEDAAGGRRHDRDRDRPEREAGRLAGAGRCLLRGGGGSAGVAQAAGGRCQDSPARSRDRGRSGRVDRGPDEDRRLLHPLRAGRV